MTDEKSMRELVTFAIGGGWGTEEPINSECKKVAVLRGADFPLAALQNLKGLPIRWETKKRATNRILKPSDIVLEISGGTKGRPTGRSVFITESMLSSTGIPVIPASFCRRLVIDNELAVPRFVYYWLQNMYAQGRTWNYQNQSTGIANFKFESFLDEEVISLPSPTVQSRIAKLLGALDDKIAANTSVARACEDLCTALIERDLTGDAVELGEIADVTMGTSPRGEFLNETGEGMPFYQGVRDFGEFFPSKRVFTKKPVKEADEGDILFAVRAPIGEVNIALEHSAIGRGVGAIRGKEAHLVLFYLLKSYPEIWNIYQDNGTVFASINRKELLNAAIPLVQNAVVLEKTLKPLHLRAMEAIKENLALARTRDELLPLLMSGKIRVSDVGAAGIGS